MPDISALKAQNSLQPREYSKGSDLDGDWHNCNADGNRLNLGDFDGNGLNCDNWNFDEKRNDNLGVFVLMM